MEYRDLEFWEITQISAILTAGIYARRGSLQGEELTQAVKEARELFASVRGSLVAEQDDLRRQRVERDQRQRGRRAIQLD